MPDRPCPVDDLLTAARSLTRDLSSILEPDLGLTVDQWRALRRLDPLSGVTMTDLGEGLGAPAATATRLVDSLVDRGLVHRRATDGDRRRVLVLQTQEGAQLARRADSIVSEHSAALLSRARGQHQLAEHVPTAPR